MKITDEMRSLIASAYVNCRGASEHSLCCAPDRIQACAAIVGQRFAERLARWIYESSGCQWWDDQEFRDRDEQYNLDKISQLRELTKP